MLYLLADEGIELLDELALRRREGSDFGALVALVDTKALNSADQRVESSVELDWERLTLFMEPRAARALPGGGGVTGGRTRLIEDLGAAATAHTEKFDRGRHAASKRRSLYTVLTLATRRRLDNIRVVRARQQCDDGDYP
jgi:hypothetical protein